MFAYSERDLTFAARKLADDVAPAVKQRRPEIVAAPGADQRPGVRPPTSAAASACWSTLRPARSGAADGRTRWVQDRDPSRPAVGAIGELVDVTNRARDDGARCSRRG